MFLSLLAWCEQQDEELIAEIKDRIWEETFENQVCLQAQSCIYVYDTYVSTRVQHICYSKSLETVELLPDFFVCVTHSGVRD